MIPEKSMLLITSKWNNMPTFRLIPLSDECPYVECIFDPADKTLAVVGKNKIQRYIMQYKIDAFGDPEMLKGRTRPGGKNYKEERRQVETFQEYYIEDPLEIYLFIQQFATNTEQMSEGITWNDRINKLLEKREVPPGEITLAQGKMEAVKGDGDEVKIGTQEG